LLLIISLASSSVGWLYFIYFFSVGYGYSIVALAGSMFFIYKDVLSLPTVMLLLFMVIFGARLGTYLLYRQNKTTSYQKILYQPSLQEKKPFAAMCSIWFFCALLYVLQVSPVAFRLMNTRAGAEMNDLWAWIGAAMIISGTLVETISDYEKSEAKKRDNKRFVSTGLYSIVRCPNYLGEIIIWTGAVFAGFGAALSVWQWIVVVLGYLGIVYVMFSGARRLEMRQNEVYADNPEYKAYIQSTPILIPFIPLYSVEKYKWMVA